MQAHDLQGKAIYDSSNYALSAEAELFPGFGGLGWLAAQ